MNKADLVERIAHDLGGRAEATTAIEVIVDAILREVAEGGSVGITGFGTFERIDRAPRTGRNPRTGAPVPIEATSAPRFRPGTYFKRVVCEPEVLPTSGLAGVRVGNAGEGGDEAAIPQGEFAASQARSAYKKALRKSQAKNSKAMEGAGRNSKKSA